MPRLTAKKVRRLTPEGRERIRQAALRRWATIRAENGTAKLKITPVRLPNGKALSARASAQVRELQREYKTLQVATARLFVKFEADILEAAAKAKIPVASLASSVGEMLHAVA